MKKKWHSIKLAHKDNVKKALVLLDKLGIGIDNYEVQDMTNDGGYCWIYVCCKKKKWEKIIYKLDLCKYWVD